MRYRDRRAAGRELARALRHYASEAPIVLALPRGGVVLGAEVARALQAPLDLVIARKIGHPLAPEYAVCALAETGELVCNEPERAQLSPAWLAQAVEEARHEAARRRAHYRAGHPPAPLTDRVVIIVDDGIATGLTVRAAIQSVRNRHPKRLVLAVPVAPPETAHALAGEVDDLVILEVPVPFLGAVGAYYEDFHQVSDEEVMALLPADPPRLFALPDAAVPAERLAAVAALTVTPWEAGRFPNGELHLTLSTEVRGDPCCVLGSLTPPDSSLLTTLLLCHTLKQAGAQSVLAVLPYLAYMRQERREPQRSQATAWLGALLPVSGIDHLVTVDLHSPLAGSLVGVPITILSPAALFAETIRRWGWEDATLVAPDAGALTRVTAVGEALGTTTAPLTIHKRRTGTGLAAELRGSSSPRAIIVDDILDTGLTLLTCAGLLRAAGAERIRILVTHGLFTGQAWEALWARGVEGIACTDTVSPPAAALTAGVEVLSVLPLLSQAVTAYLRQGKGG